MIKFSSSTPSPPPLLPPSSLLPLVASFLSYLECIPPSSSSSLKGTVRPKTKGHSFSPRRPRWCKVRWRFILVQQNSSAAFLMSNWEDRDIKTQNGSVKLVGRNPRVQKRRDPRWIRKYVFSHPRWALELVRPLQMLLASQRQRRLHLKKCVNNIFSSWISSDELYGASV